MKKSRQLTQYVIAFTLMALLAAACGQAPQPSAEATSVPAATTVAEAPAAVDSAPASDMALAQKLNVNTATSEELLAAIPNLGDKMVAEFEDYRPYDSRAQFRQEIGKYVDEAQLDEYEKYVFVPLDVNTASSEDLLATIPGLGDKMVAEFEDYRPYSSIEQFRQEMGKYVDEATIAEYEKYIYVPTN